MLVSWTLSEVLANCRLQLHSSSSLATARYNLRSKRGSRRRIAPEKRDYPGADPCMFHSEDGPR